MDQSKCVCKLTFKICIGNLSRRRHQPAIDRLENLPKLDTRLLVRPKHKGDRTFVQNCIHCAVVIPAPSCVVRSALGDLASARSNGCLWCNFVSE